MKTSIIITLVLFLIEEKVNYWCRPSFLSNIFCSLTHHTEGLAFYFMCPFLYSSLLLQHVKKPFSCATRCKSETVINHLPAAVTGRLSDNLRTTMAKRNILKLVWATSLIVSSWMVSGVHTELYTCLADMEELLETEALLIKTLNGYIQAQEDKLQMLRRLVNAPCFQFWL